MIINIYTRVLTLRLMEKIEKNPEYAKKIGVKGEMKNSNISNMEKRKEIQTRMV